MLKYAKLLQLEIQHGNGRISPRDFLNEDNSHLLQSLGQKLCHERQKRFGYVLRGPISVLCVSVVQGASACNVLDLFDLSKQYNTWSDEQCAQLASSRCNQMFHQMERCLILLPLVLIGLQAHEINRHERKAQTRITPPKFNALQLCIYLYMTTKTRISVITINRGDKNRRSTAEDHRVS